MIHIDQSSSTSVDQQWSEHGADLLRFATVLVGPTTPTMWRSRRSCELRRSTLKASRIVGRI